MRGPSRPCGGQTTWDLKTAKQFSSYLLHKGLLSSVDQANELLADFLFGGGQALNEADKVAKLQAEFAAGLKVAK